MRRFGDGRGVVTISPTSANIITGQEDLGEWTDEELIRGQRKNKKGRWVGRKPVVVPSALHQELTRRRFSRAYDLLAESLVDAALMLRAIVNDQDAANSDRIKAAEVMMDRVLGKPKEQVAIDLQGERPWQRVIANAIVGSEEQAKALEAGEIQDGEVVEDEILDDTQPLD